jgi:phospholipid/cholesterol/gamma-HCH transport system permease protein
MPSANAVPELTFANEGANLRVQLAGDWRIEGQQFDATAVLGALDAQRGGALLFEAAGLGVWDSNLLVFLLECEAHAQARKVDFRVDTLPAGIAALIALAEAVPEQSTGKHAEGKDTTLQRLGGFALSGWSGARQFVGFFGECILSLLWVGQRRSPFNWRDFRITMRETSVGALPIVGLISFLTGLILAFVGSVQLQKFGASIYVANLVGLGMVREMGALMTAIIMAGRTGAAFAAQLGSMKVNQEIDALKTLAIAPHDFLVTPRLIALFAMLPLLCLYSDVIGIAGGGAVGMGLMKVSLAQYVHQTRGAVQLLDIGSGLLKSVVFGGIVALTGCLRGMQCGGNASAVGIAATSAVVTGITLIVVSDAIFDVVFNILNI